MPRAGPDTRPGPGGRTHRAAGSGQVDHDRGAGRRPAARRPAGRRAGGRPELTVLRWRAARAIGCGCSSTRSTAGSTSARWPPAGTSVGWRSPRRRPCGSSTRPAATRCCVETVGVGQSEVEVAGAGGHHAGAAGPRGMGDGIQAAKAGILEIGDIFVVNKSDRDGAHAVVRELRDMIALGERAGRGLEAAGRSPSWRPRRRAASPSCWSAIGAFRASPAGQRALAAAPVWPGPSGGRVAGSWPGCGARTGARAAAPDLTGWPAACELAGELDAVHRGRPAAGSGDALIAARRGGPAGPACAVVKHAVRWGTK